MTGTGEDETAALRQRLRLAYVDSAEVWIRESIGRAMTPDELAGVIARYVGK